MVETNAWETLLPSIETALRDAFDMENWLASVETRHGIVEDARKQKVPASAVGALLEKMYMEKK